MKKENGIKDVIKEMDNDRILINQIIVDEEEKKKEIGRE